MALASTLLIASAGVSIQAGRAALARRDLPQWKPVWWLKRDLASSNLATQRTAEYELMHRLNSSRLSDSQMHSLAMMPLINMSGQRWLPSVSIDCAARLREDKELSDEDMDAICRRIIGTRLEVRSPVRWGDPIGIRVHCDWNGTASRDVTTIAVSSRAADVDGYSADISSILWSRTNLPNWSVRGGGNDTGAVPVSNDVWKKLAEGPHQIRVTVDARVSVSNRGVEKILWRHPLELTAAFNVVPSSASTVEMVIDDLMRDQVRRCVTPDLSNDGTWGMIWLRNEGMRTPIALCFDVYFRTNGTEVCAGSFTTPTGSETMWYPPDPPRDLAGRTVDVLLRPSNREAARHYDVRRIWGEEVVFHKVKLQSVRSR